MLVTPQSATISASQPRPVSFSHHSISHSLSSIPYISTHQLAVHSPASYAHSDTLAESLGFNTDRSAPSIDHPLNTTSTTSSIVSPSQSKKRAQPPSPSPSDPDHHPAQTKLRKLGQESPIKLEQQRVVESVVAGSDIPSPAMSSDGDMERDDEYEHAGFDEDVEIL